MQNVGLLVSTAFVALERRHLMVWAIFAPKFAFEACGMVMGEDVELHDVMIASSKSEVAFNLLLEVRNKMVDAWEQLSRSSV